jgi:hypothetical protein
MAKDRDESRQANPALDKEKAEGSRETIEQALGDQGGSEREADAAPGDTSRQGVTNRPLEDEQREQSELPPRGERKGGAHA